MPTDQATGEVSEVGGHWIRENVYRLLCTSYVPRTENSSRSGVLSDSTLP